MIIRIEKPVMWGQPSYKMWNDKGELIWEHTSPHNQVQDNLLYSCASAHGTIGSSHASFLYGKCGTGSGQGVTADNLQTHVAGAWTQMTSLTYSSVGTITVVVDFAAGVDTGTITEVGLFSYVTDNSTITSGMLVYDDTINKTKGAADTLQVTWAIWFTR